jgi:hypothetical protein
LVEADQPDRFVLLDGAVQRLMHVPTYPARELVPDPVAEQLTGIAAEQLLRRGVEERESPVPVHTTNRVAREPQRRLAVPRTWHLVLQIQPATSITRPQSPPSVR